MAKGNGNLLLQNISGQIGKQFVVKQYKTKIVISAYPDIKKKSATALAQVYQNRFRDAVTYMRAIIHDPAQKAVYEAKLNPGQRVCNYAISEYLTRIKAEQGPHFHH